MDGSDNFSKYRTKSQGAATIFGHDKMVVFKTGGQQANFAQLNL